MVQCCPMHASCTFPQPEKRDYGGAFLWQVWGGRKVFGSNEEKIDPRGFFVSPHVSKVSRRRRAHRPPCLHCKPAETVFRCFGDAIHACVQMAAAVVCLPQTVRRGCDIVRCMWQIMAAGPGGRRDCVPDEYFSSLAVSD